MFNYSLLVFLIDIYCGIIIVFMMIVYFEYFNEIIGRFRYDGRMVYYFILMVLKEILLKWLCIRVEGKNLWVVK